MNVYQKLVELERERLLEELQIQLRDREARRKAEMYNSCPHLSRYKWYMTKCHHPLRLQAAVEAGRPPNPTLLCLKDDCPIFDSLNSEVYYGEIQ